MNKKKFSEKSNRSHGFTLAEMLACILVLSVLVILTAVGFKAMKRSLASMEEQYKAGILAEELLGVITEEIRFSKNLTIQIREPFQDEENHAMDSFISYTSITYGEDAVLQIVPLESRGSCGFLTICCGERIHKATESGKTREAGNTRESGRTRESDNTGESDNTEEAGRTRSSDNTSAWGREYCPYESSYRNIWICPLDDETPIFRWDSDENGVMVSFGICNEAGEIKASVNDVSIRILNKSSH